VNVIPSTLKDTMTNHPRLSLTSLALASTLAATLVLGACSTMPADNAALMNARAAFESAQNNAQTRELAAAELAAASTALNRANEAFKRGDKLSEVDHLAYLANQRVAVAQQTAKQKAADAMLVSAEAERDRTRLAARTNEADAATAQARRAQEEAQASQRTAQASREQSEAARQQAETATRVAQAAQMQTAQAQARAMQLETQVEEQMRALNAKKTERGMVVTIGDVLFDSGRAQLKSGSARDMGKLAEFFKTYPQRTALVEGFTDSVGSDASNQDLSNRRADAVRAALVEMGVARERINARGYGEAFPVAGNDNASGRQMNRRVEIVLSDDSGQVKPR
jgi:outer membrane protein OmpA-like peptidoglycan-associated protein